VFRVDEDVEQRLLQQKRIEIALDPDNPAQVRNVLQLLVGSPQSGSRLVQLTVQLPASEAEK
jgi:hypothetical protein